MDNAARYTAEYDDKKESDFLRDLTLDAMSRCGASRAQLIEVAKKLLNVDHRDYTDKEVEEAVDKWMIRAEILGDTEGKKSIRAEVEKWIESNKSNNRNNPYQGRNKLMLRDCYIDLGLKTIDEKASCRMAFKRMCEKGLLEKDPQNAGSYRTVGNGPEKLDFINADTTPFPVRFPLGVHELVETYEKSLVVIAGEPNSGKTAYCLNTAWKNRELHPKFFSCEGGAAELKIRLQKFGKPLGEWAKQIDFYGKSDDYTKNINPDGLNIIDYLEVSKDFYEIGGMLTDIYDALNKGVAVVAIQKPVGRLTGVGGERTLDKARLYLAIEPGILRIVKGKLWRQDHINPNGLWVKWSLGGGANFKIMPDENGGEDWRRPIK